MLPNRRPRRSISLEEIREEPMWDWKLLGFTALGVAISVVLPLIRAILPRPQQAFREWVDFWDKARPYVATALFSLLVAVLLMAYLGDTITSWKAALLAGYSCDSTLQKLATGNMAPR
jgi:hypothetical protein